MVESSLANFQSWFAYLLRAFDRFVCSQRRDVDGLQTEPRRLELEFIYQLTVLIVKRPDVHLDLSVQHHLFLPVFLFQDVTRLVDQIVVVMAARRVPHLVEWLTVVHHLVP